MENTAFSFVFESDTFRNIPCFTKYRKYAFFVNFGSYRVATGLKI